MPEPRPAPDRPGQAGAPRIASPAAARGPSVKALWLLTAGVFAVLYVATAQRGVSWQDSGMFQFRVWRGDYYGDLGLALAHPLYIAGARAFTALWPGHLPFMLNAFSGIGMAVALANLAAVATLLTGRRWIGFAAAAMLGVAHTPWWLSTIAQVRTWTLADLTVELWLLVLLLRRPRWQTLAALAFVSGLGWTLHNFALLALPVYLVVAVALLVRRKLPAWSAVLAAAAYLIGAGPYLAMIVREAFRLEDGVAAIRSALFGNTFAAAVLNIGSSSKYLKENAALTSLNFVSFLLPLAAIGWAGFRRRLGAPLAACLAAITVIMVLFVIRYPVPDQFNFTLPALVMIALAAAVGLAVLTDASANWRRAAIAACVISVVLPPVVYAAGPTLVRLAGFKVQVNRQPMRDEIRYWVAPWKQNERSAELFAVSALRQASGDMDTPAGVIVPDDTSRFPLLLKQQQGLYPGVIVQYRGKPLPGYDADPRAFRAALGDRPVFVVTPLPGHAPAGLLKDADFTRGPEGVLYRVKFRIASPESRSTK